MSQTMTFAPSRANLSAVACPIPRPAPVMIDTLFFSFILSSPIAHRWQWNILDGGAAHNTPKSVNNHGSIADTGCRTATNDAVQNLRQLGENFYFSTRWYKIE